MQMLAGAMIAPVLPKIAMALPSVPMIWGDGIHDDAPGLNALIRGEVVEFVRPEMGIGSGWVKPGIIQMPHGVFKVDAPVRFSGIKDAMIYGQAGTYIQSKDFDGDAVIVLEDSTGCTIQHFIIERADVGISFQASSETLSAGQRDSQDAP
jgi:hypothetical protein